MSPSSLYFKCKEGSRNRRHRNNNAKVLKESQLIRQSSLLHPKDDDREEKDDNHRNQLCSSHESNKQKREGGFAVGAHKKAGPRKRKKGPVKVSYPSQPDSQSVVHSSRISLNRRRKERKMSLPILAKKVKKIASMHILSLKLLLNGRGFSKFKKQYRLKGEMGQGGFGVVYRAIRIADDLPVAVKFIERKHVRDWGKLNDERVPMEICMLARCSKIPGVIRLLDWFNMPEGFLIIMERPSPCIDLFDFIHNQQLLDENLSRFLFRQITQTTWDCAERKVLHRDLKDENVVIDLVTGETKIIDFGAATLLKKTRYHDFQGTRLYCPPEWFLHSLFLGREATIWSLGILLYNMVNGRLPFHNEKDICTAHLLGPLPFFTNLSKEVQDLIEKCLSFDPFSRPTLEEVLQHPWMNLPTPEWLELTPSTSMSPFSYSSNSSEEDDEEEQRTLAHYRNNLNEKTMDDDLNKLPSNERSLHGNQKRIEELISKTTQMVLDHDKMIKADKEVRDDVGKQKNKKNSRVESGMASGMSEAEESSGYYPGERRARRVQMACGTKQHVTDSRMIEKPDTTVGHHKQSTLINVRRNAKTSLLQPASCKYSSNSNNSDLFSKKFSVARPNFRPSLHFNLKKNGANSFDSGTCSALQSPRNAPLTPYVF